MRKDIFYFTLGKSFSISKDGQMKILSFFLVMFFSVGGASAEDYQIQPQCICDQGYGSVTFIIRDLDEHARFMETWHKVNGAFTRTHNGKSFVIRAVGVCSRPSDCDDLGQRNGPWVPVNGPFEERAQS